MTDGQTQMHLATKDLNLFECGHGAFPTDDIAAFKQRLEEKNIPY